MHLVQSPRHTWPVCHLPHGEGVLAQFWQPMLRRIRTETFHFEDTQVELCLLVSIGCQIKGTNSDFHCPKNLALVQSFHSSKISSHNKCAIALGEEQPKKKTQNTSNVIEPEEEDDLLNLKSGEQVQQHRFANTKRSIGVAGQLHVLSRAVMCLRHVL